MPERETVTVGVECDSCGLSIIDDAVMDKRLIPFLQTKGLCEACKEKGKARIMEVLAMSYARPLG